MRLWKWLLARHLQHQIDHLADDLDRENRRQLNHESYVAWYLGEIARLQIEKRKLSERPRQWVLRALPSVGLRRR